MANRATVSFHTTPEIKQRLGTLAAKTRRSSSFLANEAIEQYLRYEEEFVAAVEEAIVQADRGELIPHEDVEAFFDSLSTDNPLPFPLPRQT